MVNSVNSTSPAAIKRRVADSQSVSALEQVGISPVLSKLFASRGITSADFTAGVEDLPKKETLSNCVKAGDMIANAVMTGKRIIIVGDYDADGATSTALMLRAIRSVEGNVDFIVPDRMIHGYGLSPAIAKIAKSKGCELLVTVDNGVSAFSGIETAKSMGMTVIVTDHHLQGDALPNADCLVNPNLNDSTFATRNLAGVGVAFYVMGAMRESLRQKGWSKTFNLGSLLDLVAIGTVGDMVPLDKTNRILVKLGIAQIRAGKASAGIAALLEIAQKPLARVSSETIGFTLAPRINAAGRLETADIGIKMLASDDMQYTIVAAKELEAINNERKQIQQEMTSEAMDIVDNMPEAEFSAIVFDASFHEGVVGLVASRIKDRLHVPSAAFALAQSGELKGSFRSIPGINVRDAIDLVSKRNEGLVLKFGGHAMAAGAGIKGDGLALFKTEFSKAVSDIAPANAFERSIETDGDLKFNEISIALADEIAMENWGSTIPTPTFDGLFRVVSQRPLSGKHLKLVVETGGASFDAIHFGDPVEAGENVSLVYRLDVNEYRGERKIQLMVQNRNDTQLKPKLTM